MKLSYGKQIVCQHLCHKN